jgi:hypothetical protein
MNHNHAHDPITQAQIERALAGQRSGDEMIDLLAAIQPQPDSAFQNQLEDRLLAQHQQCKSEKEHTMQATGAYTGNRTINLTAPLTLLAASLALVFGISILLFMGGQPAQFPGAAQAQASATPTLTPSAPALATATPVDMQPTGPDTDPGLSHELQVGASAELAMSFGAVTAWIPVQIMSAWHDGEQWWYGVIVNGLLLEIPASQLRPAAQPGSEPSTLQLSPTVHPPTVPPMIVTSTPIPGQPSRPTIVPTPTALSPDSEPPVPLLVQPTVVPPGRTLLPVVIAQETISRGTRIEADMLALVFWPPAVYERAAASAPDILLDADLIELVGQYASADIRAYNPVRESDLTSDAPND